METLVVDVQYFLDNEARSNRRRFMEAIRVPALIMHGDRDPLVLPRMAVAMAHAIPRSRLVMVPDMGHMMFDRKLEAHIVDMIREHMQVSGALPDKCLP